MGTISRRTFIRRAGLAAAATGLGTAVGLNPKAASAATTMLSSNQTYSTYTIGAGDVLEFDPNKSVTLTITGSGDSTLLVKGTLRMRPASPAVVHKITFTGGGEIMVMDGGSLDLWGSEKEAWNRTGDHATWSSTDELIRTPIAKGDYTFRPFTKGGSVPSLTSSHGTFKAEILNLTRNVVIEGTPGTFMRRIMMMGTKPNMIGYAEVRYAGDSSQTSFYPIHFHFMGEAARGSVVEGVVVKHTDHHAFVVHASHGVTVRDCIAYDIEGDAYWWDPPPDDANKDPINDTNDGLWENCVAADVHRTTLESPVTRPSELSGFLMGAGTNNVMRGCVAVGIRDSVSASGFHWPSKANGLSSAWVFEDCMTHNSETFGIFVWQNTPSVRHNIDRFVSFNNRVRAVKHGAYNNRGYHYRDCVFFNNGHGLEQNAQVTVPEENLTRERLSFERTTFDDPECLILGDHNLPPTMYTLYLDCDFANQIVVRDNVHYEGWYDFVRCGLTSGDFKLENMHPKSVIRVQAADGSAFQVTAAGTTTIASFWDGWSSTIPKPGEEFPDWKASCGNR